MTNGTATPVVFSKGDIVRVRPGTTDPDFTDFNLGGWVGVIQDTYPGPPQTYLIAWGEATLQAIPPAFQVRCDRDGLAWEEMWLGAEDLELNEGREVAIELSATPVARPLRMDEAEDRVRAVMGLSSDEPLPHVNFDTLHRYYEHLTERLTLPFRGAWERESINFAERDEPITVHRVVAPERDGLTDMHGLFCVGRTESGSVDAPLAEVSAPEGSPNHQLLKDFAFWFWNYR